MDRMEMAHIRLEAALEASQRWSVTSAPLLRWRSKLKRAAQECDRTLRRCRQRMQEEEEDRSSLPRRVARITMSFVSSIVGRGGDEELGGSVVRRFEWFADGASEFLRYVEHGGGTLCRSVFFDGALVRHLLEGKGTKYCFVSGRQHLSFVLQPFIPPERGMQATLLLLLQDSNSPENNFQFTLSLRISESTNIVGSVVRCLELFKPHLSSATEVVKTKLTQLPTQDFPWIPDAHSVYGRDEPGDNLEIIFSKWVRPNPLCCQQLDQSNGSQRYAASSSSSMLEPLASDIYLEPVTYVYLLGHITLPAGNKRQLKADIGHIAEDSLYLKLGWNFWPHSSSEDLPPAVQGSATETFNGEATQHGIREDLMEINYLERWGCEPAQEEGMDKWE
nr:unnamed protein product [Digitaria exilis]